MHKINIEIADPCKLFLVWWMLEEQDGEEFIFQYHGLNHIFSYESSLYSTVATLREEGLFDEIELEKWIYDAKSDEPIEKHLFYVGSRKPKTVKEGMKYGNTFPELPSYKEEGGGARLWFTVQIPKSRLRSYIDEYLSKWRNDELYFRDKNILKCSVQIADVVKSIFGITSNFSYKNMLIGANDVNTHRVLDFTAVILFLESVNVLKIVGHTLRWQGDTGEARITFRVHLEDRFFQNFVETSKGVDFSLDRLVAPQKPTKQIFFDAPFRLYCGSSDYRLNRGGVPHWLMNMAFADRQIVSVTLALLRERAKVDDAALDKALENFRRSLRSKFGFPESEPFFDIRDGEVRLDSIIFQKKVKKV